MPIQPAFGRSFAAAPKKFRGLLHRVLLAGVGLIATRGDDATILVAASPPAQASSGGALVICGGGELPDRIRDRFVELAGGPRARIVVIPTAAALADGPTANTHLLPWSVKEAASLRLLHTRSRDTANDAGFVRPLTDATGVWFAGGSQLLLTGAYLGTEVERQLKALLDRGGVIGGTGAGAAVMSGAMITGGRAKADVSQGFDFLPGTVVDQEFLKRNRLSRLLSVLTDHPELIGLGIDERTALVVDLRSHLLNVIGDSFVVVCVPGPVGQSARLEILKPGDEANLTKLKEGSR